MKKISVNLIAGILLATATQGQGMNAEGIYNKVNQSVYTIYTVNFYNKKPEALGSAIAVTDHILATNCHVVLTGNYLGVVVNKQSKLGTLFFRDVPRDLCFVEIPGMKFTPVKIRDSKDVKVGEQVFAVGNPQGLEKSISQGIVSNKREDRGGYILQTDAVVSFGSSGGGLFDQNGALIGITNSVDRYSRNIAFALPTEWISQILFPKAVAEAKTETKVATAVDNKKMTRIGDFGKAKITLFKYHEKCFVYFTGRNEYGENKGSAIWYPEKPSVLLVFPNSVDVTNNFKIMNHAFYSDQQESPSYSSNFLLYGPKKYEMVGIKDENGSYPLLVSKIPTDAKEKFPTMTSFDVKYGDGTTVQGYTKVSFGLDGFKDMMSKYQEQCKQQDKEEAQEAQKS